MSDFRKLPPDEFIAACVEAIAEQAAIIRQTDHQIDAAKPGSAKRAGLLSVQRHAADKMAKLIHWKREAMAGKDAT